MVAQALYRLIGGGVYGDLRDWQSIIEWTAGYHLGPAVAQVRDEHRKSLAG